MISESYLITRSVLLLVFISVVFCASSQTFEGELIDKHSGEAVAFANIGILNKNTGTVSDAAGRFKIELSGASEKDSLRISCIGYLDRQFLIHDLKNEIVNVNIMRIDLIPISYDLDEILIKPTNTRNYTLGYPCDSSSAYGNAFYSSELGTEIGVVMKLPRKKEQACLRSFRFYVGESTFDVFPVRMNIYALKDGLPGENILREPVFIDIQASGEYVLDLSQQNITVNGDFFVSLEYYRVPDNTEGKLIFCAVHSNRSKQGESYYRWTSQGNWQREMFEHVGFSVEVECRK